MEACQLDQHVQKKAPATQNVTASNKVFAGFANTVMKAGSGTWRHMHDLTVVRSYVACQMSCPFMLV